MALPPAAERSLLLPNAGSYAFDKIDSPLPFQRKTMNGLSNYDSASHNGGYTLMFVGKLNLSSRLLFICILFLMAACSGSESDPGDAGQQTALLSDDQKEAFARQYCTGCHTFPQPELLDKNTWLTQTLPAMGPHLGIRQFAGETYPLDESPALPENFYPEEAVIDSSTWQAILDYYESEAPERFDYPEPDYSIEEADRFFVPKRPSYRTNSDPMVSAVKIDGANNLIYLADATIQKLLVFNASLEIEASIDVPSPISDIQFLNPDDASGRREMLLTHIGNVSPSDALDGSIISGWFDPETSRGNFNTVILDNVRRPVETLISDLNGDGLDDLLVSEFGHRLGSLFWLKNNGTGYDTLRQTLNRTPGCIKSRVTDFTGNGRPDVRALCTQLDQRLYLYENMGDDSFIESTLLQFPISAGSSSFDFVDINGDGHPDILYTSGDNADYSIIYKPYHGVYLYLNDGKNNFSEEWFYPINGAYRAIGGDFSGDGLMDIAVTSFFADYARNPQEGFVFFENRGGMDFRPFHPQASSYGRWIAMDTGDVIGNGRDDIVLANFSRGPTKVLPQIEAILTQSPHLLLLENRSDQE